MNNAPPVYFDIRITHEVVFRDWNKTVVKVFEVGDVIKASHDTGTYFVTPMGGVYHDEAVRV
jgi:hypothetical protein